MNLVSLLETRAAEHPERPALVEASGQGIRHLGFGELAARVRAGAAALRGEGIGPGDAILFLHPVSIELYVALLSAMRIGAVPMLVDPGAGLAGIRAALGRVRPKAWTGHGKGVLAKWLVPGLWGIRRARTAGTGGVGDGGTEASTLPEDTPALITFTSGSTGRPKAAVRSHGFLLAQNRVLGRSISLRAGETDLVTLPVFALANLAHGVTSVLAPAVSADPATVARLLESEGIDRCAAAPAFFARLLDAGVPLAGMRKLFTGGGPVFPPLLERLAAAAPAAEIAAVYGSTEAEPIAHLGWRDVEADDLEAMRAGGGLLAGRPVDEIDLAILPDRWGSPLAPMAPAAFAAARLGPGEAGEIVVAGEHVLAGYLDGIGDEETKFRVGERVWHRTGDAGRLDGRGRLWLLGRCGAVVRDARGELFPFAVETQLSFVPGVRRSAVVRIGERRVLVVEADHAPAALLRPEGIDEVRRLDRIPVDRRHRSKIDYPRLLRSLGGRS